jgi:hypothetical protein
MVEWDVNDDILIVDVISDHYKDNCINIYHNGISKLNQLSKYQAGNNFSAVVQHIRFLKRLMKSIQKKNVPKKIPQKYKDFIQNYLNMQVLHLESIGKI